MKREGIAYGQHSKNFLNGVASQLMFLEVEVGSSEARSGIYTPRRLGGLEVKGLLLVMVSLSLTFTIHGRYFQFNYSIDI